MKNKTITILLSALLAAALLLSGCTSREAAAKTEEPAGTQAENAPAAENSQPNSSESAPAATA